MSEKTDLRIIKTRRVIRNVFLELMDEEGFAKVTVKKIIERAEINRSTFYLHYVDKYDLLDKLEDELLAGFKALGVTAPVEEIVSRDFNTNAVIAYVKRFTSYVHENGKMFALLVGKKGDPVFMNKVSDMTRTIWSERRVIEKFSVEQGYAFAALNGMLTSLITEWVKRGYQETPDEFGQIMVRILRDLPQNIFSNSF